MAGCIQVVCSGINLWGVGPYSDDTALVSAMHKASDQVFIPTVGSIIVQKGLLAWLAGVKRMDQGADAMDVVRAHNGNSEVQHWALK